MIRTGHYGISGIQAHSTGEIYPWTIVVQGVPNGVVYAMHGGTGQTLTRHPFVGDNFKNAHRLATQEAVEVLSQHKWKYCRKAA